MRGLRRRRLCGRRRCLLGSRRLRWWLLLRRLLLLLLLALLALGLGLSLSLLLSLHEEDLQHALLHRRQLLLLLLRRHCLELGVGEHLISLVGNHLLLLRRQGERRWSRLLCVRRCHVPLSRRRARRQRGGWHAARLRHVGPHWRTDSR